MSIHIDWTKLLEDGPPIEEQLRNFLDAQFQAMELPPFIQSLSVSSLQLGTVAPEVIIRHISDPFPEFYEADSDEDSSDNSDNVEFGIRERGSSAPPLGVGDSSLGEETVLATGSAAAAPMKVVANAPSGIMGPISIPLAHPFGRASTVSGVLNYSRLHNVLPDVQRVSTPSPEPDVPPDSDPFDLQTFVEFKYAGDMRIGVSTTLLVNYPAPNFLSLPIEFQVTGLDIHSLAVIAYVRSRLHFSVLCDIDDNDQMSSENVKVVREMRMESRIGDSDNHGAVLRNVGRVEKFILEQLRRVIRDELVWPGWITLEF